MFLKKYQQKTLEQLTAYLEAVPYYGLQGAFERVRDQYPPRFKNNVLPPFQAQKDLPNIPYICLRLPTGGGKTLLCAHSIALAADALRPGRYPLCLWLVPTDTIRSQTLETLKNPHHLNARALQAAYGSHFRIFDISEYVNIRPYDLEQYACIVVSTFAALRVEKTEGRRAYDHHEELEAHFTGVDPHHPTLERDPHSGRIKHSFVNVLHMNRPLVLVDEAHNAKSDLSMELLTRLNPLAVIEYTATPAANSNILVAVTAQELKDEEMIKLPIQLQQHASWQQAVSASIHTRAQLEQLSHKEPDYIRPIILFQAENKNGEVNVEALKNHLCVEEKIPEEQIAIATGNQRELDHINLLQPDCPIKYIITVQALKEGWDCSFAYVLCSVASSHSATAIEQLLGRVLRMPYASARSVPALNRAYAHVTTRGWPHALNQMQEQLVHMGFERYEAQMHTHAVNGTPSEELFDTESPADFRTPLTCAPDLTQLSSTEKENIQVTQEGETYWVEVQAPNTDLLNKIIQTAIADKKDQQEARLRAEQWQRNQPENFSPAERNEPFVVPQLCLIFGDDVLPLELKPLFYPTGWNPLDHYTPLTKDDLHIDAKGNVHLLDVNHEKIVVEQEQMVQQALPNISVDVTLDDLVMHIRQRLLQQIDVTAMGSEGIARLHNYVHKTLHDLLLRGDVDVPMLGYARAILERIIKERWNSAYQAACKQVFQQQLLADDGRIGTDPQWLFSYSPTHYPVSRLYAGNKIFKYHYYRHIADMNSEEADCAWALERLHPTLKYWVRNLEKQMQHSFWLQTSTDRFYPDFVAQLKDGRILVVEYKGQFLDNEDSREKKQIGKLWAEKSGNLFMMVWKKDKQGRDMDAQLQSILKSG